MQKKSSIFYSESKLYTIFAILLKQDDENLAYVGKTTSKDLHAVLRRHLRGECSLTRNDFRRDILTGIPQIIPLEIIHATGSDAYRHTLCWYRILDERGYMLLGTRRFELQAYDMGEHTAEIYQSILSTISIDDVLSSGASPSLVVTEDPPTAKPPLKERTQLNIRVAERDKDEFYQLCKVNGFTQREGFLHLLTNSPLLDKTTKDVITNQLVEEQKSTITRQKATIEELERKLANKSRGQASDKKLVSTLQNTDRLIRKYVNLIYPKPKLPPESCMSFNMWKKYSTEKYSYPSSDGEAIVQLESLCYSRTATPAIFIHMLNVETQERIKLRYYPSRYHVGYSFKRCAYTQEDSLWYVAYQQAPDGAYNLTFSLPFPNNMHYVALNDCNDKPSLDDVIQEINEQRVFNY